MKRLYTGMAIAVLMMLSSAAQAGLVFVNFTNSATVPGTFNAVNHLENTPLTLRDSVGVSSGITLSLPSAVSGNSGGAPLVSGAAAAAGITAAAAERFHFTSGSNTFTYTFAGLNAGTLYDFTIFGSRNAGDARPTKYTLSNGGITTDDSATLEVSGPVNTSEVVTLSMMPSIDNDLKLTFQGLNETGNQFGYINALRISFSAVPEPSQFLMFSLVGVGCAASSLRRKKS